MKRKVTAAARMYSHTLYVKTWVRKWGHVPIKRLQRVIIGPRKDEQRLVTDYHARVPRGWKAGYQVTGFADDEVHLIDAEELRVPHSKAEVPFASVCPEKMLRNIKWLETCLQHPRGTEREAIVLDGHLLNTSQFSHQCHLFQRIHVPNFNPGFKDALLVKPHPSTHIFPGSLYEFLITHDHPKAGYDLALDYCCTFEGQQGLVQPKADLTYVLEQGVLARHHGVLWLTFSTRRVGGSAESTRHDVTQFLTRLSRRTGYRLKLCDQGDYVSDMHFKMVYLFFVSL